MKTNRFFIFTLLLALTGCESCDEEIVKYVVTIGSAQIVQKRIAGSNYLTFAKEDPKDGYSASNGFLCVTHNPGCSWFLSSGNSGPDKFFDNSHPLPPGCKVEGVLFTSYWPNNICASGAGGVGGRGSYGAKPQGLGSYPVYVNWNNSCQDDFGDKSLYYSISFIVSMPEFTDMGEEVFDLNSTISPCAPNDYLNYHPTDCATPAQHCSILKSTTYNLPVKFVVQDGPIIFSETLSINNGCNGAVTSISNANNFPVSLVANGMSIDLDPSQSTTSQNLSDLYGTSNPTLPILISIHPMINIDSPAGIAYLSMNIAYSYYE